MSTDNKEQKEQELQLAAYNTQNQIAIHDSNIMVFLSRWSVILPIATVFYTWTTPSLPFLKQLIVHGVTLFLLVVICLLQRKYDALIEIRFNLMHDIEGELGFRAHKDVYDCAKPKGIIRRYRRLAFIVTLVFIGLVVANLISTVIQECVKCN